MRIPCQSNRLLFSVYQTKEKRMQTHVHFNSVDGIFEVTVRYAVETYAEQMTAARKALKDAKVPECVKSFRLLNYQMNRYQADPKIAEFFQQSGLALTASDVGRMDWYTINELVRFIRSQAPLVAV